jgi:hypothetical protein
MHTQKNCAQIQQLVEVFEHKTRIHAIYEFCNRQIIDVFTDYETDYLTEDLIKYIIY